MGQRHKSKSPKLFRLSHSIDFLIWFLPTHLLPSALSLSGTVIWIRSPCSSHFSVSLAVSSRQNKPGTFDSIVMDDFAEWKMTGYFLKSITAAATGLSQKGSVEQRRNLGDFVWCVFDAARDWLYEFHLCVSISALSRHVSLDHIHCLSQFLHSFPLWSFCSLFSLLGSWRQKNEDFKGKRWFVQVKLEVDINEWCCGGLRSAV